MKRKRERNSSAPVVIDRAPDDYVRLPEVMRRTGLSRPTIYRRMDAGTFPPKKSLGFNTVAWREGEIVAWTADPMGWTASACPPPSPQKPPHPSQLTV